MGGGGGRSALEGPQRQPQKRLGRRLEEFAKAVGGRLLSVTNAIDLPSGGQWLGGGGHPPPLPLHPWGGGGVTHRHLGSER